MRTISTLILLPLLWGHTAMTLRAEALNGRWWTQGREWQVQIYTDPEGHFAGKVVAGPRPDEKDVHNPDPRLRQRPLLGLVILQGFVQDTPLDWKNGQIYDPESGNYYKAKIWLSPNDPNHLKLKGYIGFSLFGRTSEWTRELGGK